MINSVLALRNSCHARYHVAIADASTEVLPHSNLIHRLDADTYDLHILVISCALSQTLKLANTSYWG